MSLELLIFGIDFRLELSRLFVKASFLFPPPFKTRFNIALFLFQVVQPAHKLRYTHQFIASIQFLIGTNLFRCLFKGLQLAGNYRLDIVDPQEVSCRIIELSQGLFFTETIFGNACRFLKMVRRSSGRLFRISSILFWPMMESDPRPNPVSARRFTISFNRQFLPLMAYSLSPLRYTRRRILTSSKSTGRS